MTKTTRKPSKKTTRKTVKPTVKAEPLPEQVSWEGTQFELVPIKQIKIEHEHASGVNPRQATRIAANFKPHLFGALTCVRRGDTVSLIKGATRLTALLLTDLDISAVPVHCLTLADDAVIAPGALREVALQIDENRRAKLHPIDEFRQAFDAGRSREKDIARILSAHGLQLRHYSNEPRRPRTIDCHNAWCHIWNLGNTRLVREVAQVAVRFPINHITGEIHPGVRTAAFLRAVANTITRYARTANEILIRIVPPGSQKTAIEHLDSLLSHYRPGFSRRAMIEFQLARLLEFPVPPVPA